MKRSTALSALAAAAIVAIGAPSFAAEPVHGDGAVAPGTMPDQQSQAPSGTMPDAQNPSGTMPDQQEPSATMPDQQMPDQQTQIPPSDSTRIIGKVVQIDREQGMVALATDEGMLLVQAPPHALQSIDVGDVVAIPRALAGSPNGDSNAPSASPQMEPPSDSPQPNAPGTAPETDSPHLNSPEAWPHSGASSAPDKI